MYHEGIRYLDRQIGDPGTVVYIPFARRDRIVDHERRIQLESTERREDNRIARIRRAVQISASGRGLRVLPDIEGGVEFVYIRYRIKCASVIKADRIIPEFEIDAVLIQYGSMDQIRKPVTAYDILHRVRELHGDTVRYVRHIRRDKGV